MFAVADGYNYAMQSVTYRANQLQAKVFAGDAELNGYIDQYNEHYWKAKLTYDVLDSKDIKDLKYIKEGWKSIDDNGTPYGPQGSTPNYTYFTQKQRYQDIFNHEWNETQRKSNDPVGWSADWYKEWEDMHDPNKVMWYDTAACWNTGRIMKSYGAMFFRGDKFKTEITAAVAADPNTVPPTPAQPATYSWWSKGVESLDTGGPNRADAPANAVL